PSYFNSSHTTSLTHTHSDALLCCVKLLFVVTHCLYDVQRKTSLVFLGEERIPRGHLTSVMLFFHGDLHHQAELRTCFTTIAFNYLPVWMTLDYVADLMYLVDMIITVHTGYLDQGILIKDLAHLKKRYLRSKHFLRDLVSLLPTDSSTLSLASKLQW
ncbi:Cyclic nucleotide-gated cation channel alpha-4, partial [Dissostichus eleginoides]